MLLRTWDEIPDFMKNDEVKRYYEMLKRKRFSLILKRLSDVAFSILLIIVLSPVFLGLAIWIKLDDHGPVFYRQERITQYGRVFCIYKFRTMAVDADQAGSLITLQNDKRITGVGSKIRKSRLDEIPQLFNILAGDMSFVGTRPEVNKYVTAYSDEMKATLLLPAGVTSLASIRYKDEDAVMKTGLNQGRSVDDVYLEDVLPNKMELNLAYLKSFNIVRDVFLCVKTVIKI